MFASTQHNNERLAKIAKRMQKTGKTKHIANYYLIAANGFIEKDSKLTKLMNIYKAVSELKVKACQIVLSRGYQFLINETAIVTEKLSDLNSI